MNHLRRLFFSIQYHFKPRWDTGITPPEVEDFVARHPPGRALDLGCGTGTNVIYLFQHGWQVTGVDFIHGAIRQAKQKARQAGVEANLLVGDVTQLSGVSGPFDLILDIGCFHSLPVSDRKAYLDNVVKLLSKDGSYLLYAFFMDSDNGGPGLTNDDLERMKCCLELVDRQDGEFRGRKSAYFTWLHSKDASPIE
jgi:2-polyprenyl-3-methyl-5-hydroxy-6-metoxy-1,4-benzoquinol methylase